VVSGEKMQIPSMPFKILALAPFRSIDDIAWTEEPIQIDNTNLDQVIDELGLSFYIPIPRDLCPAGGLDIRCKRLKDFHPDGLIQSNAFLKNLLDAKRSIQEVSAKGLSSREIGARLKEWPDLPPIQIKTEPHKPKRTSARAVDDILKMVALPGESPSPPSETYTLTDQIDTVLQQILSYILFYEKFRNLEVVWRGLKLLIQQGGIDGQIKLGIVPVSFETLDETLSSLTTRLIQDLPSLVIVDLPFDNSPRSLEFLEKIARFSETLLVPTISWITHKFLYLDTWQDLEKLPFLPHYLEGPAFAKWRRLRQASSANWLVVTCNRFLARYSYGTDNKPRLVPLEERRRLWASPVWAIGCLLAQSVVRYGWPTRFTEWQHIRLEDLALNTEDTTVSLPTEAAFAEDRIHQFIRAGIMPLIAQQGKDVAFTPAESTLAGGSLGYQAFVSRITQFLLWCRDNFKKDLRPSELQEALSQAFSLFWEKTGHLGPENLEITASEPGPDERSTLRIALKPSRKILPAGEKVEMEFVW
jgi:type VI secretion system protein ImpC